MFGDSVGHTNRATSCSAASARRSEATATPTPTATATPPRPPPTATATPTPTPTRPPRRRATADARRDAPTADAAPPHGRARRPAPTAGRHAAPDAHALDMAKDRIPTSRIARTARVVEPRRGPGGAPASAPAPRTSPAPSEGRSAALERRHLEAAEQIVTALGTMKGAAMKLGQVMSFLDVGLVPEEHREEFQRKLGELRDAAPKVRFADMRKVIESELEEPLERDLRRASTRSRSPPPRSARSTARRLHDGREVAVKVQYPGVAQAVRADMQNLGMILRLMKRIAPGLDVKATAEEIRCADRRGARLRARGPEPARARAHLPRATRSSSSPTSSPRSRASG